MPTAPAEPLPPEAIIAEGSLRYETGGHPTLRSPAFQTALQTLGPQRLSLPTDEPLPAVIRYGLIPDPGDLYVSAPELLRGEGRAAVEAYAREWGALQLCSAHGVVARLTRTGRGA